ncbi:NADP-dependent oxidoreductase domain-containing protein [Mycena galopus ATCC 62051]|nr:NADP-dependent oxidoreductase domain-containing protein [Mycena galopus ATCC 62051]
MAKTLNIPLVLGTGSFGLEGAPGARLTNKTAGQELVDVFLKTGGSIIDTSKFYGGGTAQKLIAQFDIKDGIFDTKLVSLCWFSKRRLNLTLFRIFPAQPGAHSPENLRAAVEASVKDLGGHKINVLYLHAPDRSVPFVDIAREINELHKKGLIREFGLSNFFSWEKLGIRFYGYSPLAGSILVGKDLTVAAKDGSRFDSSSSEWVAAYYNARYSLLIPPTQELRDEAAKHGISLPQVAFRWLQHHSQLDASKGDKIVIGSYSLERYQQTLGWKQIYAGGGPRPALVGFCSHGSIDQARLYEDYRLWVERDMHSSVPVLPAGFGLQGPETVRNKYIS